MKNVLMTFLILSVFQTTAQMRNGMSVELTVLNDSLVCKRERCQVVLEYSVRNITNDNLLLYGVANKLIDSPFGKTDLFCDEEKTGVGIVFFLFDENMLWRSRERMIMSDYSQPMTKRRADSLMSVARSNTLKSSVVLKKEETKRFSQVIDLSAFNLLKGRYYLQLRYYAGRRVRNVIGEEQIINDTLRCNADVYQGCTDSNLVVLSVD